MLGNIFNDEGERLTPTYAMKKGLRYRYYISISAMQSRDRSKTSVHRVPAETIDVDALNKDFSNNHLGKAKQSEGALRWMEADERVRLLRGIATARRWLEDLSSGAVADIATLSIRESKSERSVRMTLSLAFLDPAMIAAAVGGRLPRGYMRAFATAKGRRRRAARRARAAGPGGICRTSPPRSIITPQWAITGRL